MSIFNSLGSNYNFNFVLKSLLSFDGNSNDLEKFLEEKYGGKVTLVYKGREAIKLALKSLNLPADGFVAINGFTCFAVYEAIKKAGLNVEYLDIEKADLNFSPETLKEHLDKNPKIKAVIIQNTLGFPCEAVEIAKICKANSITLIEDLAHSVGARYSDGSQTGSVGDMVILSFSQDKMIDGISGGTLISTKDNESDAIHVPLRKQTIDRLYPFFTFLIRTTYSIGLGKVLHFILKNLKLLSQPIDNLDNKVHKLPAWYCNLIKMQFEKLQENLIHRKKIASIFAKLISPKIVSPKISSAIELSSNLRFPIFVDNRQNLIQYLADNQIFISDIWYDAPISPKRYLAQKDYKNQCPNSELASEEILNLPTHINISEKEAERISDLINLWLKSK